MSQGSETEARGFDEGIDLRLYLPIIKRWAVFVVLVGVMAFGLSWVYMANLSTPTPSYTSHSVLILEHAGDTDQYLALSRTFGDRVTVSGASGVITLSVTSNSERLASEHADRTALRLRGLADNLREAQREGHVREYELYKRAIIEVTGEEPERLPYYLTSRRLLLGHIVSKGDPVTSEDDPPYFLPRDNPLGLSVAIGVAVVFAMAFMIVALTNMGRRRAESEFLEPGE